MKHTPGPWKTSGRNGSYYIEKTKPEEEQANARLIAAAPELLEIAEMFFNDINSGQIDSENGVVIDSYHWHKLKSAITKATQP